MPLNANFLADFSSFINACRDATTSTEQLVEAAGKVGADVDQAIAKAAGSIKQTTSSIGEFAKTTFAVLNSSELKDFLKTTTDAVGGFVKEFAAAEQSTARLTVGLKDAGQSSPAVIAAYREMATQLSNVSRFSTTAITDAQAIFTTIGRVGPENMEKVLKASMDLAISQNTELEPAARKVAIALGTQGEKLGVLRSIFGDAIPKGAEFADIMQAINEKFGGSYQADLQTTVGQYEQLKNQMADINEQIGSVLAENLKTIIELFKSLPESVQNALISVVAIGTALAPVIVSFTALAKLLSDVGLGAALSKLGTALGGLVPEMGLVAVALFELWGIWHYWDDLVTIMSHPIEDIRVYLVDVLPAAFHAALEVVKQWDADMKVWLYDKLLYLVQQVIKLPALIVAAFKAMYMEIIGMSSVPDLIDGIATHFGRLGGVMVDPALAAVDQVVNGFKTLSAPIAIGTLTAGAAAAAGGGGGAGAAGAPVVTVNMTGMLGTDDPQTRAMMADLVSNAVMQGMRGTRRLGTV